MKIDSALGSYDFFAKTLPGALFFIGILSVLPSVPSVPTEGFSFAFVSIALIVTVLAGYVIGQALHSIAVAAESTGYRFTILIYDYFPHARTDFWRDRSTTDSKNSESKSTELTFEKILINLFVPFSPVYCWIVDRINEAVLPHRIWFKHRLQREFDGGDSPDGLYDWFKLESRDQLKSMEMDLVEQHEKVYRFVMSYLEMSDSGRARKFQATASFCRSTWITLLIFGVIYTIFLFSDPKAILGYSPEIDPILNQHGFKLPISLVVGSLLFMYSTGRYKSHFTEYIAIDFYNAAETDAGSSMVKLDTDQVEINVEY